MPEEHRQGLGERKALIERRALDLATAAIDDRAPWIRRLGDIPARDSSRREWQVAVAVIAAYRDRYGMTSDRPLGGQAGTDAQRAERARAADAVRRAQRLAGDRHAVDDRQPTSTEALGIE